MKKILCDVEAKFNGVSTTKDTFIEKIRSQKDSEELQNLRKAAELVDYGAKVLEDEILVEGKTEAEVAVELDYAVRSRGAQAMSFCSIIATGEHSSFPHHTPTNKVISEGDVVLCDFGAVYQGYCSDLTRTFPIGSVSEDLMQVYEAVLEAQKEAIRAIKLGEKVNVIEHKARCVLKEYGYADNFIHAIGHGIGLELHEAPLISLYSTDKIEKGNVFTVEPGVYIKGKGGVRIEDDVYVSDGVEVLTKAKKVF